jgi:hypothetical protein
LLGGGQRLVQRILALPKGDVAPGVGHLRDGLFAELVGHVLILRSVGHVPWHPASPVGHVRQFARRSSIRQDRTSHASVLRRWPQATRAHAVLQLRGSIVAAGTFAEELLDIGGHAALSMRRSVNPAVQPVARASSSSAARS